MSHKAHPKSLRIKEISDWSSRGFYRKNFPSYLKEDFTIREFLKKKLHKMGVEKVEIERSQGKINIIISSSRPGLIIGRGGSGAEEIKKESEKILKIKRPSGIKKDKKSGALHSEIRVEIREVKNIWSSAELAGDWVAQQLEKRIPHRRTLKQVLEKIMTNKEVKGARVEVAGRLGGAEIARREWLKIGRLPRQTLRAEIDYAKKEARCTYGTIGIKVWIYKGDIFKN